MLRRQRVVQVGQDRHILRAWVRKVGLVDPLYRPINYRSFNGFQSGLAAHNQLTKRQHKVGFQRQRVFVLGIIQIDVQRVHIVGAGG